MLLAALQQAGAQVVDLGVGGDNREHLEEVLAKAFEADVDAIVSSGGVSMGDRDLIKAVLTGHGAIHFGKVLMKPGKPLTFATLKGKGGQPVLFFGLPGNPVSSFVCFHLVVAPSLRKLQGSGQPLGPRVQAAVAQDLKLDPERPEYHRATLHWDASGGAPGRLVATSTGSQISSRLLSTREAHALLELPRGEGVIRQGTVVSALLVADLRTMAPTQVPLTSAP